MMKYDELAFLSEQLAALLNHGTPLGESIRQLCAGMSRGRLKSELERIREDIAKGISFEDSLDSGKLPAFYRHMVRVGVKAQELPKLLLMLRDHYQGLDHIWGKLKRVMLYPVIVLFSSFCLSLILALTVGPLRAESSHGWRSLFQDVEVELPVLFDLDYMPTLVLPPLVLFIALAGIGCAIALPGLRRRLTWRLPGFKEAAIAQAASCMSLMLKSGGTLGDALDSLIRTEGKSMTGEDMAHWKKRVSEGHTDFYDIAVGSRAFPPLFIWMVENSGEDMPAGLDSAARIYGVRASYRTDMMLYGAMPVSIMVIGLIVFIQMSSILTGLAGFFPLFNLMQGMSG